MPGLTIVLAHSKCPPEMSKKSIGWIHEHIFPNSLDTVGIIKNGAMIIIRTMPCPNIGWSRSKAISIPSITVIARTLATIIIVVPIAGQKSSMR